MNPYLIRLRAMRNPERHFPQEPAKPSKPLPAIAAATSDGRFEHFAGNREAHFLKIHCTFDDEDATAKNLKNATTACPQNLQNPAIGGCRVTVVEVPREVGRYKRTFAHLELRRPAYIEETRWRQCITDGRAFLRQWGETAQRLNWSSRDLFGLIPVPSDAKPSFSRLSRYDQLGLCWTLEGRGKVVALTAEAAVIHTSTDATLTYYRHGRPAYGPVAIARRN
jgi:hypothetical protein